MVEGKRQIVGKEIGFQLGKLWSIPLKGFWHRVQAEMEENLL